MPQWYLYMVRCRTGTLYTGIATDVSRRLEEHRKNGRKGAKYLRGRGPLELVLKSLIGSRGHALKVEDRIKKWPKSRKEQLVEHSRNCEINWGR